MSYIFEIPRALLQEYAEGRLMRSGAVLKYVDTGQIAGHLQETGTRVLSDSVMRVLSPLFGPVAAATGIVDTVQNEQIKAQNTVTHAKLRVPRDRGRRFHGMVGAHSS